MIKFAAVFCLLSISMTVCAQAKPKLARHDWVWSSSKALFYPFQVCQVKATAETFTYTVDTSGAECEEHESINFDGLIQGLFGNSYFSDFQEKDLIRVERIGMHADSNDMDSDDNKVHQENFRAIYDHALIGVSFVIDQDSNPLAVFKVTDSTPATSQEFQDGTRGRDVVSQMVFEQDQIGMIKKGGTFCLTEAFPVSYPVTKILPAGAPFYVLSVFPTSREDQVENAKATATPTAYGIVKTEWPYKQLVYVDLSKLSNCP